MKNIGKPCAGKSHARFDEGRLMDDNGWLTRSSRGRRGVTKVLAGIGKSVSYSTPNSTRIRIPMFLVYIPYDARLSPRYCSRRFCQLSTVDLSDPPS